MITATYNGNYFYIADTAIITDDKELELLYEYFSEEVGPSEGPTSVAIYYRIEELLNTTLISRVDREPKQGEVQ